MKFAGIIGYAKTEEVKPGVWRNNNVEKNAVGDWIKDYRKFQGTDKVNDNLVLTSSISIIADPYALQNYSFIKYVKFGGIAWKVESVEPQFPRLILSLGGVYNAQ